jgi:putative phosphoribosyl transferase
MADAPSIDTKTISVPIHRLRGPALSVQGQLSLPPLPEGLVVLATAGTGTGGSPIVPTVTVALHDSWIGTLCVDLLLDEEATQRHNHSDQPLLAERLLATIRVIDTHEYTRHLPLGFFGGHSAAAAALLAATREPRVTAIVSYLGRSLLAEEKLAAVRAATLLIVDREDAESLALSQRVFASLRCEKRLVLVPGADDNGSLADPQGEAVWLATEWFAEHLDR